MEHRLLRRADVEKLTALSRSTIYAKIKEGTFPKPVPVGPGGVRWIASEVEDFISQKIAERDQDGRS